MKRIVFRTPIGEKRFDRRAAAALAVLQCLTRAGKKGLQVPELLDDLLMAGVLMQRNEKSELSNLLQQLREIGAVDHPNGNGGSHRYVFCCWPAIEAA